MAPAMKRGEEDEETAKAKTKKQKAKRKIYRSEQREGITKEG